MNILLVSYVFFPEPIAMSTIVEDMAVELSKVHNVTVLTSRPCRPLGYDLPKETTKDSWKFQRVILDSFVYPPTGFIGRARESYSFGKVVAKYINAHKSEIDVVYGCIQPLFGQHKVVSCCNKNGIPCVIHVEDIYPEPFLTRLPGIIGKAMFRLFFPIDKYVLNNATKVVAIGPKLREYLINTRHTEKDKVEYVYNWQDDSRFNVDRMNGKPEDVFTYMYVGSLSAAANLLRVAMCYVKANPKVCRFVFAGSGALKEPLMQIAMENPSVRIEFWDAKSSDVPYLQSLADVLVLPLKSGVALKAFPSKFPAYLYSKKPVLAFVEKESDVADCISQSGCGWIVDPKDEEGLTESFLNIPSNSTESLITMGINGYEFGHKYLTKKINLDKMCSIILTSAKQRNKQ